MKHTLTNLYRVIFARPRFQSFNLALFNLGLRGLGIKNFESQETSGERYLIERLLPDLLKRKDPIIFDIGANIGEYTKALQQTFPNAIIHCLEPNPKTFSTLESNFYQSNIHLHQIGLGESPGSFPLYDRSDLSGSSHASLHQQVIEEIHHQKSTQTEVIIETLDRFTTNIGINYIDFLKIDTEGNELAVLQGASKLLANKKIGCIHFEFNEMNIVSRSFLRDFRKLLPKHKLYRLLPRDILPLDDTPLTTEIFAYQNIIALPTEHLPAAEET